MTSHGTMWRAPSWGVPAAGFARRPNHREQSLEKKKIPAKPQKIQGRVGCDPHVFVGDDDGENLGDDVEKEIPIGSHHF